MSERLPELPPLEREPLHGRSLESWHRWLTTDHNTGERNGHLKTPVSRYGSDADECAWYALAAECVYVEACGESSDEDPTQSLDFYMGLVVNDHEDIASLLREYWVYVPAPLQEMLDQDVLRGVES